MVSFVAIIAMPFGLIVYNNERVRFLDLLSTLRYVKLVLSLVTAMKISSLMTASVVRSSASEMSWTLLVSLDETTFSFCLVVLCRLHINLFV